MRKTIIKSSIQILFILFIGYQSIGQSNESKWVLGASVSVAKFSFSDRSLIGDQYNFQVPRINISRYFFKELTLDASFSFNTIDEVAGLYKNATPYKALDIMVRYDFGTSFENFVPYVAFGGGLVQMTRRTTSTYNFGTGFTYWLNSNYGVNSQLLYKYSQQSYTSMRSHAFFSVGVVYSFKWRNHNPRVWERK